MYFRALLISGCIALTGCQSTKVVEQQPSATQMNLSQVSELLSVSSPLPSSKIIAITKNSQVLKNELIDSPVAVFAIPANRGQLSLKITSEITESVFYPYAVIYDGSGKQIESYGEEAFSYYKPKLHLGNRLVADVDFYPPTGTEEVYMVVYTKEEALTGFTEVAHPARLDAEGRGNHMPEMKDIPIPHSLQGTIELEVSGPRFSLLGASNSTEQSSSLAKQVSATPQPETQAYFLTAIEEAVAANDIPKALSLLDEAKALNIEGAQDTFVKALEAH